MRNRSFAGALGASLLVAACKTPQQTVQTPLPAPETETRQLDTMEITADAEPAAPEDYTLPVYRAEEPRPNDLLHTKLRVRFDWAGERVMGQATLRFTPTFYPQDSVTLDAVAFALDTVALGEAGKTPLAYRVSADSATVTIALDRTYKRGEEYELYLAYTATPRVRTGGSSAISSDKGLFFINPRGEDSTKPRQIWTQGETEHNSTWMPTIDQPNERATQEFYITVDSNYLTLSNGLLVSSTDHPDGTRTDYWRMDQPHAPYLHMLAVGEFAKVDDQWRDIPLSYYVEEEYRPYAKEIFAHTPEMLEYFSTLLGYDYPWSKFSQIIVRDYVSGAMENTGAVVFGEFVQKDARELADDNNDLIVAHEMFHHWFGDLVTTESWSNLTLNEGFANYSEYLWLEHHDGLDAAEEHRMSERDGYFASGARGAGFHPLIWYGYDTSEDMFDGHSYNKGGLTLHMLRKLVGDEAFFASLKRYLTENAFTAVEADELRLAFEEVTGLDLHWFFDQWFYGNGQPELSIRYGYADGNASVTVEQTQDPEAFRPIFRLPTQVGIYPAAGGAPVMVDVVVDQRRQTFTFPAAADDLVVFDPEQTILAVRDEPRDPADQARVYQLVPNVQQRLNAIRAVREAAEAGEYTADVGLIERALADSSVRVRNNGIALIAIDEPDAVGRLSTIARRDLDAGVRANALGRLGELDSVDLSDLYLEVLTKDSSYGVMASGLQGYFKVNPTAALVEAERLEGIESDELLMGIANVYAQTGDAKYSPFFARNLAKVDGQAAGQFAGAYLGLAMQQSPGTLAAAVREVGALAQDQSSSLWRRYGFTGALAELRGMLTAPEAPPAFSGTTPVVTEQIEAIKAAETNEQLKEVFSRM